MKVAVITGAKGVDYSEAPQGSPEWVKIRAGRIGASQLYKWMATSKRDGKPLQSRKDLEREKAFEKAFNVPFSRYVTAAMQAGIDNEDFVREQYAAKMGVQVEKVGAFYDKHSVASPDGLIGLDGGLEIKWLQDSNWTIVAESGKPLDEHYYQIQGNLRLSGRQWWDYVAANGSTGRFIIIHIERDSELIGRITESVKEVELIEALELNNVYEFSGVMPEAAAESETIWD